MQTQNNNEVVRDLTLSSKTIDVFGNPVSIIPAGARAETYDHLLDNPRRVEANRTVHTAQGFIDYNTAFLDDSSVIFGHHQSINRITAIIDYHCRDLADWCAHSISLEFLKTSAWETWLNSEKKRFSQREFAAFIEDNSEEIAAPAQADLINQIRVFKKSVNATMKSKVSGVADDEVEATATSNTSKLPDIIELAITPYLGVDTYKIKARLQVSLGDNIEFSYHFVNADRVIEKIFNDSVEQIEKELGRKVII